MNKIGKKNKRFAELLIKQLRKSKCPFKDFKIRDGYFVYEMDKNSVIYFTIFNYQFGIWQNTKEIFADHFSQVNKLKPSGCYFSEKYETILDIFSFIRKVLKFNEEEYFEWEQEWSLELLEQEKTQEMFRKVYQWIIKYNGIENIKVVLTEFGRTLKIQLNKELSQYSDEEFWKWQEQFEKELEEQSTVIESDNNCAYTRYFQDIKYYNLGELDD